MKEWLCFIHETKLVGYPVHFEVDTGMPRLGFGNDEVDEISNILRSNPTIQTRTVFSHLASSSRSEHDEFTREQFRRFDAWYRSVWMNDDQNGP